MDGCGEAPPPGLLKGINEYHRGLFFECHETLEALWKAETRPMRQLYQGMLQIAVAFHHLRAGRYRPVISLLERGSAYLMPFRTGCMGVDVAGLVDDTARCLAQLKLLGPEGLDEFDWSQVPRIDCEYPAR